jgi:glycosyltransferase involved in cell wall biosynthesis
MNPFDIFMPTFNSAKLLPVVLPQIEKVIPASAINKKFIIDDFSSDDTREVAESLGWTVFRNKRKGLLNAQIYGFSLVTTECCALFEHDLYLASNWYPTIPNLVQSERT